MLTDWLEQPIEELPVERNEVLLKLFFGCHQSKEDTLFLLKDYQQKLEKRYLLYSSIEKMIAENSQKDDNARYWLFTLDYGKRITFAAIEWCKSTSKQV